MVNEHNNLTEQIITLTAERDESREEVQRLRGQVAKIDNLIEQVQTLEERFAALRSAPGMEEVVGLLKWLWTHGQCLYPTHTNNKLIKKLYSEVMKGK